MAVRFDKKRIFGKEYYYGHKLSNYFNYEKTNTSRAFKRIISFIEVEGLQGKYLDIGCAFGFLIKEVSCFFDEVYGCDISEFAINKAKNYVPYADLRIVDLDESLPHPKEYFDCITAMDVLEHTKDFKKNFEKLIKRVKKGGYLIVSSPIDAWPYRFFGFLDNDKTHISVLKEKQIIDVINKNSMEIIKKSYFSPFPLLYKIPFIPFEIELILRKSF
ncbi:hypothetical protein CMO89_00665 [Candidatus Woesearchaeota archaeon]|nr:hypothetical protein [Candidatus Woesearchaeota archaeon]|tara:strand:- start:3598 stop:4248 length:651 start_codon:yes stop_codon:yes gene_type:complete